MPDRTDSGQGRDALDAAMDALEDAIITDQLEMRLPLHAPAARAAVRKAVQEMGEEQEVMEVWYEQGAKPVQVVALHGNDLDLAKGDRVRVVKVEP